MRKLFAFIAAGGGLIAAAAGPRDDEINQAFDVVIISSPDAIAVIKYKGMEPGWSQV
jgi:hypothetical protein